NSFSNEDIERFVTANPLKRLLNGSWILSSGELIPTRVPSYCDSLFEGTKFHFDPKGNFDIYEKDSTNKCGSYSYKIFEDRISFVEYDMVMRFEIETLTPDSLILKSKFVPMDNWNSDATKARENGYK